MREIWKEGGEFRERACSDAKIQHETRFVTAGEAGRGAWIGDLSD
jgi:hypothetical protein